MADYLSIGEPDMIACLICPDGAVDREWVTTRADLALTADRNLPGGWWVRLEPSASAPVPPPNDGMASEATTV